MKQAIVARADLGMGPGKLAAQVAHAAVSAADKADSSDRKQWRTDGQQKIVLKVDGADAIEALADQARREGLPVAVIRDAGRTQLEPGTLTAVGIGPAPEHLIDRVTGELSLF